MKFSVRNLGRLKEVTLDLSRDLIVLTGRNNTSKTYVAHAVYGFCRYLEDYLDSFVVRKGLTSRELAIEVRSPGFVEEFIRWLPETYQTSLDDIFAAPDGFVDAVQSRFELSANERFQGAQIMDDAPSSGFYSDDMVDSDEDIAEVQRRQRIIGFLVQSYFGECASPFILTAERAAIQLFSRELSLKRSKLVDWALRERSLAVLERGARRYPLAIRDSLQIMDDLAVRAKQASDCVDLADKLEGLLEGRIQVDEAGEMTFRPVGAAGGIVMHLSSSSVKSLSGLAFYLRHIARPNRPGGFLIIDEPELNLHPDNQRAIARILACIVNARIKVMISTHSDYVIREINNLIMLSSASVAGLRGELGYSASEMLRPEQVGAYLFHPDVVEELPVSRTGFAVSTIDREINRLNNTSARIYDSLVGEDA